MIATSTYNYNPASKPTSSPMIICYGFEGMKVFLVDKETMCFSFILIIALLPSFVTIASTSRSHHASHLHGPICSSISTCNRYYLISSSLYLNMKHFMFTNTFIMLCTFNSSTSEYIFPHNSPNTQHPQQYYLHSNASYYLTILCSASPLTLFVLSFHIITLSYR